ncbi:hypothetical protein Rhe02_02190 [Rhizocola hellebori]|uniref:Uncharacterized protein n=1 Tax=Rhizocola hellebori TaxID=1392758 RepID=A0A8J3Q2F0_9ACTN|nr:hypothetical protein [Rhizocola hellebori]GIH02152.1 hypothetical protein Rhe02_02190 [Rhizocola hellebori]
MRAMSLARAALAGLAMAMTVLVAATPASAAVLKPFAETYVKVALDPKTYVTTYAILDYDDDMCQGSMMQAKATWYIGEADSSRAYVTKVVITAYTTSRATNWLSGASIYDNAGTTLWHNAWEPGVEFGPYTWVNRTHYINKWIALGSGARLSEQVVFGAANCWGPKDFRYYLKRG